MPRFECLVVLLEVPFILLYFVFLELNSSIFNTWNGLGGGGQKFPFTRQDLCSGKVNLRIEAQASYSQKKLETEIPTTLVPRLNEG